MYRQTKTHTEILMEVLKVIKTYYIELGVTDMVFVQDKCIMCFFNPWEREGINSVLKIKRLKFENEIV